MENILPDNCIVRGKPKLLSVQAVMHNLRFFFKAASSLLKRNIWAFCAFLIPLAIRSIPEFLSWPYPLGLDTLRYIPTFEPGLSLASLQNFLHSHLFYSLGTIAYRFIPEGVFIIKLFGPLLLGLLAFMLYLYAKAGLRLTGSKAFIVALLTATYFISLRNSWDLYSQTVGLIFLFAALIMLKASNSSHKYPFAFVFMILTVLSHELPSIILFFILLLEAIRFIVKRQTRDLLPLLVTGGLAFSLFFYFHYSPKTAIGIEIPLASTAVEPSLNLSLFIVGLMIYSYFLLMPLVILGLRNLKDRLLLYWAILCVGIPIITMAFPTSPLYFWNRWAYLLVYPLLFFAVEGLSKVWSFWDNNPKRVRRLMSKGFAIAYMVLLLSLSAFYLSSTPDSQISFFADNNPYLSFIPSTMLQNTIAISDNPALMKCFQWINNNSEPNSSVVIHYALYDLANLYVNHNPLVNVDHGAMWAHIENKTTIIDGMIQQSQYQLSKGYDVVYTIWWVEGKGWYDIPSLPTNFLMVFQSGNMAVYQYNTNA